jgi:hypothetical protein
MSARYFQRKRQVARKQTYLKIYQEKEQNPKATYLSIDLACSALGNL